MYPSVIVRDPTGTRHELVHGDLIGRIWSAALPIDDGRVSEAHAMISLREGELQLISLRGPLAVRGVPVTRVTLTPGVVVHLARELALTVEEISLPDLVVAVHAPGRDPRGPPALPRQTLPGVCSILTEGPNLRLTPGWRDDAACWLWSTGEGWRARGIDGEVRPFGPGDVLSVGDGIELHVVGVPLRAAGAAVTRRSGEIDAPLTVIAHFDNAHVVRAGQPTLVLPGKQGQLVSELAALGGPVAWTVVAHELWPDADDDITRRGRLDALMTKLRRRLRGAGIREDVVRTDGAGQVELLLHAHDTLVDRT